MFGTRHAPTNPTKYMYVNYDRYRRSRQLKKITEYQVDIVSIDKLVQWDKFTVAIVDWCVKQESPSISQEACKVAYR